MPSFLKVVCKGRQRPASIVDAVADRVLPALAPAAERGAARRPRSASAATSCRARLVALWLLAGSAAIACAAAGRAQDVVEIKIGYLHAVESKERISLIDVPAENDGV